MKIWITAPLEVPLETVRDVVDYIHAKAKQEGKNHTTAFYNRTSSLNASFKNTCDALIVVLPNNWWGTSFTNMDNEVRDDILRAIHQRYPIGLAYTAKSTGKVKVYATEIAAGLFKGVSGEDWEACILNKRMIPTELLTPREKLADRVNALDNGLGINPYDQINVNLGIAQPQKSTKLMEDKPMYMLSKPSESDERLLLLL